MDPYRILNVPPGSPPPVIEQAFRVAAQKFHPNNGGTQEQFAQVVSAYNALMPAVPTSQVPAPYNQQPPQKEAEPEQKRQQLQKYALAPRVHSTPNTKRTSTASLRLSIGTAAAAAALTSGFLFNKFSFDLTTAVITIAVFCVASTFATQILLAFYVPQARKTLILCAAGIILWPLKISLLVAVASFAATLMLLRKNRLL